MILKIVCCKEFIIFEGCKMVYDNMVKEGIDVFVVIGGDGLLIGVCIFV